MGYNDVIEIVFDILNNNIVHPEIHFISPVITLAIKMANNFEEFLLSQNLGKIMFFKIEEKCFLFFPVNDFRCSEHQ